MQRLEFVTDVARGMTAEQREMAQGVLQARFCSNATQRKANGPIVDGMLGYNSISIHCYRSSGELAASEIAKYRCAVGRIGGRCVVAACFRHVPAATSRKEAWSELLLLAVDKEEERRGYGGAMVAFVKRLCAEAGSKALCVVSNGSAYWERPALGFAAAADGRFACFIPWSEGIRQLCCTLGDAATHASLLEEAVAAAAARTAALVDAATPAPAKGSKSAERPGSSSAGRAGKRRAQQAPDTPPPGAAESEQRALVVVSPDAGTVTSVAFAPTRLEVEEGVARALGTAAWSK